MGGRHLPRVRLSPSSPFIFSFSVKLPWIFFSSASMVSPPMSASRCVRFTMPMPNTMRVTCWGSALTRLRRLPPPPGGLVGVVGSCCSFSKITLQRGSDGRCTPSEEERRSLPSFLLWDAGGGVHTGDIIGRWFPRQRHAKINYSNKNNGLKTMTPSTSSHLHV